MKGTAKRQMKAPVVPEPTNQILRLSCLSALSRDLPHLCLLGSHSTVDYLKNCSMFPSSPPVALIGWLLAPLRSPLPVFLKACLIVSIVSSPLSLGWLWPEKGLPGPRPPPPGDVSIPLEDTGLLKTGEPPKPCEGIGERTGEGERLWIARGLETLGATLPE